MGCLLGHGKRAAPLDAQAVGTEAATLHRQASGADGDAVVEAQRASVAQVTFIAFVERDDESHMPALRGQAEKADGIVGRVEGSGLDRQVEEVTTAIESGHAEDTVVAVADFGELSRVVGDGNDEWELAGMAEGISSQLVEAVAVDPAIAIAIPTPECARFAIGTRTGTAFMSLLAVVIAGAELLAVRIGPGGELGPIASNVKVLQGDELEVDGARDEASVKDRLQGLLVVWKRQ